MKNQPLKTTQPSGRAAGRNRCDFSDSGVSWVKFHSKRAAARNQARPPWDAAERVVECMRMKPFEPHPLLRNPHAQTIAARSGRGEFPRLAAKRPPANSKPNPAPESAANATGRRVPGSGPRSCWCMAWRVRATPDTCWGLPNALSRRDGTPYASISETAAEPNRSRRTLYNSGLSGDYRAILIELIERDSLPEIFFAGYSMGGNLVLKMAGELAEACPAPIARGCWRVSLH